MCHNGGLRRAPLNYLLLILLTILTSSAKGGQAGFGQPVRCVPVEVYFRSGDSKRTEPVAALEELKAARGGIVIVLRDTEQDPRNQERLDAILRHYKVSPKKSPVIYGCDRIIHEVSPSRSWRSQLREMLCVEVFVRTGCSHCAAAKRWLPQFIQEYPGLELVYRDIAVDSASATKLSLLVERHSTMAASVPVFHVADRLLVGFEGAESTGERLRTLLKKWTKECPEPRPDTRQPQQERPSGKRSTSLIFRPSLVAFQNLGMAVFQSTGEDFAANLPHASDEELSLPLPTDDTVEIPDDELPMPGTESDSSRNGEPADHIEVPMFGRLSASKLGMPLFTLAIGLVDGFNPCAMWVLLFLLSILVNLRDRRRILAIAGTFVIVSGLAYFAFMAAWLNVFMLIGYLRPIQIALALMAIVIGLVHIKDFFAFKRGLSLSIPESAKPGIYARVRRIVTAEHMAGAIAGAFVLAVLVNIIELLCTAGLPALYTNILMQQ